jgi:hypothetical protein
MEDLDSHPAFQRNSNLSMPALCHRQAKAIAVVRAREQLLFSIGAKVPVE